MATQIHSFKDDKGKQWTACSECNRGGNGNDPDKCSAGFNCTNFNGLGCFSGTFIIGEPVKHEKISKAKERYQRFLHYSDTFDFTFIEFCYWDSSPKHSWNKKF